MNGNYEAIARTIREKLNEQLRCYTTIYELSVQQRESLTQADSDLLAVIIAKKQKFLDRVDRVQRELLDLKQEWEPVKQTVPALVKTELNGLSAQISRLLERSVALERENITLAQQRQKEIKRKMNELQSGKTALSQYLNTGMPAGSCFMDKRI